MTSTPSFVLVTIHFFRLTMMAPRTNPSKGSVESKGLSPAMIKGYLPIRLKLPSKDDETFFYVKEHRSMTSNSQSASTRRGGSDTLFVVNAPVVPPVPTKSLLKAIFSRYGIVSRVTVVENPREGPKGDQSNSLSSLSTWTEGFTPPTFLPSPAAEVQGKFAHVVFDSSSDMKRAYRALSKAMTETTSKEDELPGISIDTNELQALTPSADGADTGEGSSRKPSRVLVFAQRYRRQQRELVASRSDLLEECNRSMREFEQGEASERLARQKASDEPDEDGFITVSYGTSNLAPSAGAPKIGKRELDNDAAGRRKSGSKRKRKKSEHGASELRDFYRFQNKMERKRTLQDLRRSFEEDLVKIRKMKEGKQCLPF